MKKLQRIESILNKQLPEHAVLTAVPRGISIPVERNMSGPSRFAKKIGTNFHIMLPHNVMKLSADASKNSTILEVEHLLNHVDIGSIVSINGLESHFVDDVVKDDKGPGGTIALTDETFADHEEGTAIALHSVPMAVAETASAGSLGLVVYSKTIIVPGDEIGQLSNDEIAGSLSFFNVSHATESASDLEGWKYKYVLIVDGTLFDVIAGDTVYLRAYPAIRSNRTVLPTQKTVVVAGSIGPFLWDYHESRLHDGISDPDVVVAITTYSSGLFVIDDQVTIQQNTPVWDVTIPTTAFVLWDIKAGSLRLQNKNTLGTVDENGDFLLIKEIVPSLSEGKVLSLRLRADETNTEDIEYKIGFRLVDASKGGSEAAPLAYEDRTRCVYATGTIVAGAIESVQVTMPDDIDMITVGLYSESGGSAEILDWTAGSPTPTWVQYTILGKVVGEAVWACTGLYVKPIFQHRNDLVSANRYNSGFVLL